MSNHNGNGGGLATSHMSWMRRPRVFTHSRSDVQDDFLPDIFTYELGERFATESSAIVSGAAARGCTYLHLL